MGLISVSMDISGSTKIKKKISDFAGENEKLLNDLHIDFIQRMVEIETEMYSEIAKRNINYLKQVWVIKNIGDEVWFVIYIKENDDFNQIFDNLLNALLITCNKAKKIILDTEIISIIPKITLDYIDKDTEVSQIREKIFHDNFWNIVGYPQSTKEEDNQLYKELKGRLNFGIPTETGAMHRFDAIGYKIDRFFRITKYSRAWVVSIGKELYNLVKNSLKDRNDLIIEMQEISKGELKGCNEDYEVYYISSQKNLT